MLGAGGFAGAALDALGGVEALFRHFPIAPLKLSHIVEHFPAVVGLENIGDMHALGAGLENGFFQGGGTDTASFIPPFSDAADPDNFLNRLPGFVL